MSGRSRLLAGTASGGAAVCALALAGAAQSQTPSWTVDLAAYSEPASTFTATLPFSTDGWTGEIDSEQWQVNAAASGAQAFSARQLEIWRDDDAGSERLRLTTHSPLRRADGSPLPPTRFDEEGYEPDAYHLSYRRDWVSARTRTPGGVDISFSPHVGVGAGSDGGTAEAGATLRIGRDLEALVPDGSDRFGDRARWYIYAAGSGRAVGYNFARTRDGDFSRSGMSHDEGSFLGDASVGVAWRRGAVQSSFGLVYREIEAEGLRSGRGLDNDVREGLVAFQLSIKPD